jgi:sepiapterin reductase
MRFAIFVTGASRGLGRALAAAFASRLHADGAEGTFILLGRDDAGMKETATLLQAAMPGAVTIVQSMDLADLDTVESSWQAALRELQSSGQLVDAAILVNNSGSLGELKPVRELTSLASISSVVTLNVTSVIWLTSLFLRSLRAGSIVGRMGAPPPAHGSAATSHVVNVSSLCAIKAFSSQSLYCAGKAARDMLHAVVAEEEAVDGAAFPVRWPGLCGCNLSNSTSRLFQYCK